MTSHVLIESDGDVHTSTDFNIHNKEVTRWTPRKQQELDNSENMII
jgi:hypothetical protein